jgi:hypothetical protein
VGFELLQAGVRVSAKVTNGLNADGSEILFNSTKNSKDYWFDADYWFGPDGGVTFMTYQGTKDQVQNQGADNEFTYRPRIRRYGIFGNYLFFDKLDVLGGYLRAATTGRTRRAAQPPNSFRTGIAPRWITTSSEASPSWRGTTA